MYCDPMNRADPFVAASAHGDVNGDGIPDNVFLTGTKSSDSPFTQNITLVIKDGATGRMTSVPLRNNAGYEPTLFLGDFNGDRIADILIRIQTGGSGATTYDYVYSFAGNTVRQLFDSDIYNDHYKYDVNYLDYYRAEVVSRANNQRYILDLTYKGQNYLNEIYDSSGKLKSPISGWVDPLSVLYPVDFDGDGVYELLAFQSIAGRYHADGLGRVQNLLKWENGAFTLYDQTVAIYGG